jgi:GH24 family phage-related lysozyme (muramidase)
VSLAYNLSQKSFAAIADSVNQGQGIDPIALNFVRAGSKFEAGLTDRRRAEIAMFNSAAYV